MAEAIACPVRVGVFSTVGAADRAIESLTAVGFTSDEVSVICSDELTQHHFEEFHTQDPSGTNTPKGLVIGGTIGATLGAFTVIAGSVVTGSVALLAAGGAAAWAGGMTGGFIGAMMTRGIEKEAADFYDQAVQRGKILVAVEYHGPQQAERLAQAEQLLTDAGAEPLPLVEG